MRTRSHLIKLVPFMKPVHGYTTANYDPKLPIFRRPFFGKTINHPLELVSNVSNETLITGVTHTVYSDEYYNNAAAIKYLQNRGWVVRRSFRSAYTTQQKENLTSDLLYHCSEISPKGRFIFLSPGKTNAHGCGVYMDNHPQWNYGHIAYAISKKQAESCGVTFEESGYPKSLNALKLRIDSKETKENSNEIIYHCTVVDSLNTAQTVLCQTQIFEYHARLTQKMWDWCKTHIDVQPSHCLGLKYRLIGLSLAIACLVVWKVKKSLKWFALAKFLIGPMLGYVVGWSRNIDLSQSELRKDWNSGRVESIDKTTLSIRPSHHTTLFWLVGGFSAKKQSNGDYLAQDTYDFHTQLGQNTILGEQKGYSWAWSGLPDDPTKIPSQVTVNYGDWCIEHIPTKLRPYIPYSVWNLLKDEQITLNFWRFIPKALKGKYIKQYEHNGAQYLMFSNDLWNALGGTPFTTYFTIPQSEVRSRY